MTLCGTLVVNNDLERVCKESDLAELELLTRRLSGEFEKTNEILTSGLRAGEPEPPAYDAVALPI
jgi:hypothetical protein